jgi:penicillin-binding protein-related factor A (putative recombinase)
MENNMSEANRGKVGEGKLDKEFKKLDLSLPNFTYERIYDARSSMGKMANPRCGDFVLYHQGRNLLLEVKEVAHDYRLPVGNFELDQRARMRKRQIAGSICGVIVYHSTTEVWRLMPLDWFGTLNKGSWDFRNTRAYTMPDLLQGLIVNWEALKCK